METPWINKELKYLTRKKKNLRYKNCARKWKDANLSKDYKILCRIIKSEVKRSRMNYEQDLIKKAKQNPKLLYKYINNQLVVKNSIKALQKEDGYISQDQVEIANILNKCFQDVFVIEPDGALPKFESRFSNYATNFSDISPDEINYNDVLKSLNENKAFGPDKLHPAMLKNASEAFALPLILIFRESSVGNQANFQFLDLQIQLLFSKKVTRELQLIIDQFPSRQLCAKYLKIKSCATNLLATIDFITLNIKNLTPVDIVLLEFAKAFDTVPHNRLLLKLRAYGIDGLVLKWIASFLTSRRQRVVKGDIVSDWVEVFSGVPHGSVIGPFLFVVFINDFPDTIKNVSKLYADDIKILSIVNSDLCVKEIQNNLNKAFEWTQDWLLKFNISKCVVMHYGSTNKSYPLFINGIQLHDSKSERDLGIIFSTNLKWKDQVTMAIGKAYQMLGRIKKSFSHSNNITPISINAPTKNFTCI
ncbi:uncharacterized protein LOC124813894 [Hydra vulgaris]|uniref:uncharacterized protein LOC124813894 n=1 Tax=Hydra vulgaris TaxID=6087 RepID=UPI0032E9F696